jgi:hypothetical protein
MASRRSWRARVAPRGVRAATLAALLGCGVLAATALGSSRALASGPMITSATTAPTGGSPSTGVASQPKGAWMTFEVNPPSFALRPLRRFAACVRRHGVPNLQDPKVVDGKVVLMLPRGLTAKSLRLKSARRACQKLLPQGANTQPGTGTGPTTTRPGG